MIGRQWYKWNTQIITFFTVLLVGGAAEKVAAINFVHAIVIVVTVKNRKIV